MTARHMPWVVFAAAMGGAGVHGAVRTVTADRLADVHRERDRALVAVEAASRAGAPRWAPEAWQEVERARQSALASLHRADAAYWWFSRHVVTADQDLIQLGALARDAAEAARHREAEASAVAREALAAAETAIDEAIEVRWLLAGPAEQRRASRARLALGEAQVHAREGNYLAAADKATEALALASEASRLAGDAVWRYEDAEQIRIWQRWIERAVTWSAQTGRAAIVVSKADHRLIVYQRGAARAIYDVDLSRNWFQPKLAAGDGAVPEGQYRVVAKKGRGASLYHKALLLDYPSHADLLAFRSAKRAGRLPASATAGGLIEIHGAGGRGQDWTNGCVALSDDDMDAVFAAVDEGTPVTIVGATRAGSVAALLAGPPAEGAGRD